MKKVLVLSLCSVLLFASCDTYTGSSAYAGGSIGSILGSAIGGLAGGPRGSDMGTIIGMASGAAVGAVIGSQADKNATQRHRSVSRSSSSNNSVSEQNVDVFDSTNSGDDCLYDFNGKDYTGSYSAQQPSVAVSASTVESLNSIPSVPSLEIVNARFVDFNENKILDRNEQSKIIFEIMNHGSTPIYDVVPTVVETTGNKHVFISPSIHVEKIAPGLGVRYTAMVKADNRLKNGNVCFCVSVLQGNHTVSKVIEFNIPTRK